MLNRLDYIDETRGIAILAVTLAHILDVMSPTKTLVQVWCYSFELPVFFILGGFLFSYNQRQTLPASAWIKSCVKNTLWPYFTFSVLYILFYKGGIKSTITMFGLGALWFLPAYFAGNVGMYFIGRNKHSSVLRGGDGCNLCCNLTDY